jgi:hypothetical protein
VPSVAEWTGLHVAGGRTDKNKMSNDLKLPLAGMREFYGTFYGRGKGGLYYSTTPTYTAGMIYHLDLDDDTDTINPNGSSSRANALSVRCFRNEIFETPPTPDGFHPFITTWTLPSTNYKLTLPTN